MTDEDIMEFRVRLIADGLPPLLGLAAPAVRGLLEVAHEEAWRLGIKWQSPRAKADLEYGDANPEFHLAWGAAEMVHFLDRVVARREAA